MRAVISTSIALALAACGQPPVETPPEAAAAEATPQAVAPGASAGVDGWEIDMTAYGKIGAALPPFTATKGDGEISTDTLRGRWTIIGVVTAPLPPEEGTFIAALASAADQDPSLDVLMVDPMPGPTTWLGDSATAHGWPLATDGADLVAALALPASPAYLLVGPDLTIEGYRGALSATPEDGIKSVIRGVAEIRKQIAAPQ